MTTYRVVARRDGDWWSLVAADVGGREVASQSRRLEQAEPAIREAIALVLDVDSDAFEVDVIPEFDAEPVSRQTLELIELRRELAVLRQQAKLGTPQAVTELRSAGLTVRDVAQLLQITPSRVSQIEQQLKRQDDLTPSAR